MNKTILFSPVGGTDPISTGNLRDGSLLHICRCRKPDKVYMYMSGEILKFQEQDNRYTYCIERLSDLLGYKIEYEIIARPDMTDVQLFDPFYSEFRRILFDIRRDMDESDTLLLNVSSGTPAMKSALLVLKTLGEFPCTAIQVRTPDAAMNRHDGHDAHKSHDIEVMWELDEDNIESEFEDRTSEVKCPTLSQIQQESYIRKLLSNYDYAAAYEIAKMLPDDITANYIDLLQMASRRVLLDFPGVDKILLNDKRFSLPVKNSESRKLFEYALNLQLKLKRCEYADFIRGITPLFYDLYENILKQNTKFKLYDYCEIVREKLQWSEKKLQGTDVLSDLQEAFSQFHYGDVNSSHLNVLIQNSSVPPEIKYLVEDLRLVESKLRNMAAHQIVSVTDETIKKSTGLTGDKIMGCIRKAFGYAGFSIRDNYWNSYDDMNKIILSEMAKI